MAYTFLQAVNRTLKRLQVIQGSAGELTGFTDSGRQIDIDICLMVWNEVIQDLAAEVDLVPGLTAKGNVTLVNAQKNYTIPGVIEMVKLITIPTNRYTLREYPGGYLQMSMDQPDPTLFQGLPVSWLIDPTDNKISFDFTPTANEAGKVLTVFGVPRINLTLITDVFPFSDTVVDQLVPAVAMKWSKERKSIDFVAAVYAQALAGAMRYLVKRTPSGRWGVG